MDKKSLEYNYNALWNDFILDGNREAFGLIYLNHFNLLVNYGLKFTSDMQTIEDSIQNIFIYFLKVRKHLRPVINISGFLIKCFKHQMLHELKKRNKLLLKVNSPEDPFNYANSPEKDFIDHEDNDQIQTIINQCINNLTSKQREIIFLRYECELSFEDISDILDITVESCYKLVYRSIKVIRIEAEKILPNIRKGKITIAN
jgi:RNA polymerase sigma factor (sigma-70 family)